MTKPAFHTETWLCCFELRPQAAHRLFCFPYAGSGAALFRPWARDAAPELELWAVQLPGRESRMRERPLTDLRALVQALLPALRPHLDGRPFAFFGHSLGALLAYETARALQAQGGPAPRRLFVSGRRAPHLPDPLAHIHLLPDEAFKREMLQRYNAIPQVILQDPDMMRMFLPVLRADLTLIETYSHTEQPPLDLPVSAFGGDRDPHAPLDDLAAWRALTRGPFDQQIWPGDHFYLNAVRPQILAQIARRLTD